MINKFNYETVLKRFPKGSPVRLMSEDSSTGVVRGVERSPINGVSINVRVCWDSTGITAHVDPAYLEHSSST